MHGVRVAERASAELVLLLVAAMGVIANAAMGMVAVMEVAISMAAVVVVMAALLVHAKQPPLLPQLLQSWWSKTRH